jgi:hypothetical protein
MMSLVFCVSVLRGCLHSQIPADDATIMQAKRTAASMKGVASAAHGSCIWPNFWKYHPRLQSLSTEKG